MWKSNQEWKEATMDSQMFEVVIYERVFLSFSVLINSVFPSLQIYMIATDSRGTTPIERYDNLVGILN